jgi:anti-sigma factor RsiW
MNDLMLERYNLGELAPKEKTETEAAAAADSSLAARIAEIRRSDAEIRAAVPAALALDAIERKARLHGHSAAPRRRRPVFWGLAAAALLAAIILPVSWYSGGDEERAKGSTELSVYLKTPGGEAKVQNNTPLRAGDTVQLAYMTQDNRYGVIFSVDGRSAVTLLYPYEDEGESTRLVPGRRTPLADAYTLDDAPDYEIIFFVTSGEPLNVREILNLAKTLAKDPKTAAHKGESVFKEYELQTFTLRKE